jgi:hypothetical protein
VTFGQSISLGALAIFAVVVGVFDIPLSINKETERLNSTLSFVLTKPFI